MFTQIQHINLCAGKRSADATENDAALQRMVDYYHKVIGLELDQVPAGRERDLRWFRVGQHGQQIHMSFEDQSYQAGSLSAVNFRP